MDRSSVCTASERPARSCPRWPTSRPYSGTPARAHARWRVRSAALNARAARTDPAPNPRERPTQRRVSHMGLRRTAFASGPQVKRPGFPLRHGTPRRFFWQGFMKRLCASHGARTPSFASGIPTLAATELGRYCYRDATDSRASEPIVTERRFALFAGARLETACNWAICEARARLVRISSYLDFLVGETGFEPATARPPAAKIGCRPEKDPRIYWVFCLLLPLSVAQIVPQIVPQTRVRRRTPTCAKFVVPHTRGSWSSPYCALPSLSA